MNAGTMFLIGTGAQASPVISAGNVVPFAELVRRRRAREEAKAKRNSQGGSILDDPDEAANER